MNIGQHPELLDRLAAAYAIGTLKGGARRRLEAQARQSAAVRASILLWQERLQAFNELPQPITPSPALWPRIERVIREELMFGQERTSSGVQGLLEQLRALRRRMHWWQGGAWLGVAATVAAVGVGVRVHQSAQTNALQAQAGFAQERASMQARFDAQLASQPQLRYVAVLADNQSNASVLVTVDSRNNRLTVQRVSDFSEDEAKSLQLWALPPGGKPESLGVLSADRVLRLTAPTQQVQRASALAVSLEPKGGVPSETGPTGPVLFKGSLLPATL
jgi:anti-sigma-K factor RskA